MSRARSLRSRLALGAVLWTIGLLAGTHVVSTALATQWPAVPRMLHGGTLLLVAVLAMVAGLTQLRRGLSPFDQLRDRLAAVHDGRAAVVDGRYPAEVQPVVDDLNALLELRQRAVDRALARAGDLAHGLKTPLAVLAREAELAGAAGDTDHAATIREQVARMQRHIDYHLAHARAAASGAVPGATSRVAESVNGLIRTLKRLHADGRVTIEARIPEACTVRVQREDLDEMLGNLLDNACRWARSQVVISATTDRDRVDLVVDDDGPGLPEALRTAVLQRGVRADEAAAGSGLGLAIARDLAELYGGSIELDATPLGGLRARLRLRA
jgi:signal transduction histidine kinase